MTRTKYTMGQIKTADLQALRAMRDYAAGVWEDACERNADEMDARKIAANSAEANHYAEIMRVIDARIETLRAARA
jgi:ethanolamine ammonia-lyase small subunit